MEESKTINFEQERIKRDHIKLVNGDLRIIVEKAIEESFNAALKKSRSSDEKFVVRGSDALFAIEEKVLSHYSKKMIGSAINNIGTVVKKILSRG